MKYVIIFIFTGPECMSTQKMEFDTLQEAEEAYDNIRKSLAAEPVYVFAARLYK